MGLTDDLTLIDWQASISPQPTIVAASLSRRASLWRGRLFACGINRPIGQPSTCLAGRGHGALAPAADTLDCILSLHTRGCHPASHRWGSAVVAVGETEPDVFTDRRFHSEVSGFNVLSNHAYRVPSCSWIPI